jgi:hypothetical protein
MSEKSPSQTSKSARSAGRVPSPRYFDVELNCAVVTVRCPACGLTTPRYAGEPCDCGFNGEEPEPYEGWDAQDFADMEMDAANKVEAETR